MPHRGNGSGHVRLLLDDLSKRIIEQLQQDGRRSYAAIGAAVGLSEAAVRQRVQRLLDGGAMQIVAVTDPMTLGFRRQTMIGVRCSGELEQVAEQLAAMHEIDYVVITAGLLRPARRGRLRGRRRAARDPRPGAGDPERDRDRDLRVPEAL